MRSGIKKEWFNKGIEEGIKFAVENILGIIPCSICDDVFSKTTDYLIEQFHKEDY